VCAHGSTQPPVRGRSSVALGAMNAWIWVRLALVLLSFAQGLLIHQLVAPPGGVSLPLLAGIVAFGVFGMIFVVGLQRFNPRSSPEWRQPSWSISPFLLGEPLQFFHLGGFCMIAVGLGEAVRMLALGESLTLSVLFAPAFGIGVLLGVHVCTVLFRGKMASPNNRWREP